MDNLNFIGIFSTTDQPKNTLVQKQQNINYPINLLITAVNKLFICSAIQSLHDYIYIFLGYMETIHGNLLWNLQLCRYNTLNFEVTPSFIPRWLHFKFWWRIVGSDVNIIIWWVWYVGEFDMLIKLWKVSFRALCILYYLHCDLKLKVIWSQKAFNAFQILFSHITLCDNSVAWVTVVTGWPYLIRILKTLHFFMFAINSKSKF